MTPTAEPTKLGELLARELRALEAFVALLQREQTLLADGPSESVTALAAEKAKRAEELGAFAAARDAELTGMKLPAGRPGMDVWIVSPAGAANQRNWDQLLGLAAQARALNEANGQMIAVHLQHYQQGINILLAAVDRTATYGPDGQPRTGVGGRSLGSA